MTAEQQSFINTIGQATLLHYPTYKVLPSLTIAQIIKESVWGKSGLSKTCFNYTGMKWSTGCGYDYKEYNTKEYLNGKYVTVKAKFIKFNTPADGIEGHYKFIHKYKRYKSIIGETDAQKACTLMGASGWATAPNYGSSLWNDYVKPLGLTAWDDMALARESGAVIVPDDYTVGQTYTTQVDLYVRASANGAKLKYDNLTMDAKTKAKFDSIGCAILLKGTRVTCMEVKKGNTATWIRIPSGWICGKNQTKDYIK